MSASRGARCPSSMTREIGNDKTLVDIEPTTAGVEDFHLLVSSSLPVWNTNRHGRSKAGCLG
jgi:hypothetical protein